MMFPGVLDLQQYGTQFTRSKQHIEYVTILTPHVLYSN